MRRPGTRAPLSAGVTAVLAAAAVLAVLHGAPAAAPRLAPAFKLELLDGKPLSLADYKGSPVIMLFWAPW